MHQTINYKITLLFARNKTSKGKKFIPLPATHLASGNESQPFFPNFFLSLLYDMRHEAKTLPANPLRHTGYTHIRKMVSHEHERFISEFIPAASSLSPLSLSRHASPAKENMAG